MKSLNEAKQPNIKDYFLIGDLHSAALVSSNGSIDWLCLPHFDSSSIFGRLLDPDGGCFELDIGEFTVNSYYINETAILETVLQKHEVEISLKDFMVPQPKFPCKEHYLVRKITGIKGNTDITFHFAPRPDYARSVPELHYDAISQCIDVPLDAADTLKLYLPENAQVQVRGGSATIVLPVQEGILSDATGICEIR